MEPPGKTRKRSQPSQRGNYFAASTFGSLLLAFFVYAYLVSPGGLPEYKQKMIAFASALMAGLFAIFLTGAVGVQIRSAQSRIGTIGVRATGGLAAFVFVLVWWFSPFAPLKAVQDPSRTPTYRLRLLVLGQDGKLTDDAQISTSLVAEVLKTTGGWGIEVPVANRGDGKLTVYAANDRTFLSGQVSFALGDDLNPPPISIEMRRDTSAHLKGVVEDETRRPIAGARVSVWSAAGAEQEVQETITNERGQFEMAANAATKEQVEVKAEKAGFKNWRRWEPAGELLKIVLVRR
jgi:hypothetical protein